MKYTVEIEIDLPVDRVVELFDNAENLKKWMKGLERFEHISGTPGQPGATSRLVFMEKNRRIELIEKVTVRNLPHEFSGTYETKGILNTVTNRFFELPGNKTKYVSEQEYQFKGIMKIMAVVMPGLFKKQSMKYMSAFKEFAEGVK